MPLFCNKIIIIDGTAVQGCVSVGEMVVSISNVSFVTFDGFKVDCARKTAISADNSMRVSSMNFIHMFLLVQWQSTMLL